MINIYLVSQPISHIKVLLREISSFGLQLLTGKGRPVWPVCLTDLTGLAWQLSFYSSPTGNTVKLSLFTLHRHPFTVPFSPPRTRCPIGDFKVQPRKKVFLWGIWCTSPAWPLSQGGPSFSSPNLDSKGTLWIVFHRSIYLGHRFENPLEEQLLLHPRAYP